MSLNDPRNSQLSALGRTILRHLEIVAIAARNKLDGSRGQSLTPALASGTNSMVGSPAVQNLAGIVGGDRADLERLSKEPFVARVVVRFDEDDAPPREAVLYITRPSAPHWDLIEDARFVTYTAPLGQVAEVKVGTGLRIPSGGRSRHAVVIERTRLLPNMSSRGWDALHDRFEFEGWKVNLDSIPLFLDELERGARPTEEDVPDVLGDLLRQSVEATLIRDRLRRRAIERISLRDQPILDEHQGEVFQTSGRPRVGLPVAGPAPPRNHTCGFSAYYVVDHSLTVVMTVSGSLVPAQRAVRIDPAALFEWNNLRLA